MPGKERESVGHFHAFTPVQLEPMLWKIFVELSGDAFATEDTSPVWGAAPEIPVRCFPGGEEHRRRRDLLRSWRSWGEPFQREGARGAAAHKKSLSLCSAPPLAVLILGKAATHPTSPGRTGIPFAQRVSDRLHLALHGTAWHCSAQGARRQAPCIDSPASVAEFQTMPLQLEGQAKRRRSRLRRKWSEQRSEFYVPGVGLGLPLSGRGQRAGLELCMSVSMCVMCVRIV